MIELLTIYVIIIIFYSSKLSALSFLFMWVNILNVITALGLTTFLWPGRVLLSMKKQTVETCMLYLTYIFVCAVSCFKVGYVIFLLLLQY